MPFMRPRPGFDHRIGAESGRSAADGGPDVGVPAGIASSGEGHQSQENRGDHAACCGTSVTPGKNEGADRKLARPPPLKTAGRRSRSILQTAS
jgi:hypothetical protein